VKALAAMVVLASFLAISVLGPSGGTPSIDGTPQWHTDIGHGLAACVKVFERYVSACFEKGRIYSVDIRVLQQCGCDRALASFSYQADRKSGVTGGHRSLTIDGPLLRVTIVKDR
jgi:hypothetical protein